LLFDYYDTKNPIKPQDTLKNDKNPKLVLMLRLNRGFKYPSKLEFLLISVSTMHCWWPIVHPRDLISFAKNSVLFSEKGLLYLYRQGKGKGKSVPLEAWSGPECPRKLRFPDYMTTAQDGGKVVSLMHRPPLPPGNTPGTHFC
jgi:hypothetical protein